MNVIMNITTIIFLIITTSKSYEFLWFVICTMYNVVMMKKNIQNISAIINNITNIIITTWWYEALWL